MCSTDTAAGGLDLCLDFPTDVDVNSACWCQGESDQCGLQNGIDRGDCCNGLWNAIIATKSADCRPATLE